MEKLEKILKIMTITFLICPICKNNFDVAKSLFMEMGFNSGSCTCPQCKTHLHLECDEETKTMKAEDYKIYANKLKEKINGD